MERDKYGFVRKPFLFVKEGTVRGVGLRRLSANGEVLKGELQRASSVEESRGRG